MIYILKRLSSSNIFLIAIAVTIPFWINIGNIAVIFSGLASLFLIDYQNFHKASTKQLVFVIPLLLFMLASISAYFSYNMDVALKELNKSILIPIILFIIYTNKPDSSGIRLILKRFAQATTLAAGILIINGLVQYLISGDFNRLFFHQFTALYDQHPVYFALYIVFSFFIFLELWSHNKSENYLHYWPLAILLTALIFSASKAVMLIFVFLIILRTVFSMNQVRSKVISVILIVIIALLTYSVPYINQRFKEDFQFDLEFTPTKELSEAAVFDSQQKSKISDLELRYLFNSIGIYHLIEDNKILLGYGTGDLQDHLDFYYMWYGLAPNWYENYNIHNQYLHIILANGIIALILFLGYIIGSFVLGIKNHQKLHLIFLIIVSFVFLVEVMLVRNKGIIFFIFFNSLFLKTYIIDNSNTRH